MSRRPLLAIVLIIAICIPTFAAGYVETESVTKAQAAVMLDELFKLSDVHSLEIAGFEATPKNLGYTASNGAILSANVIAAAKDCTGLDASAQIEAVINSGLMDLEADSLSFKPDDAITKAQFALAIAKGFFGADIDCDHIAKALSAGILVAKDVTDAPLTAWDARIILNRISARTKVVSVFATSDIHGNYIPYKSTDSNFQIGSVARIMSIISAQRQDIGEENVIYVDGGDSPYNTTLANISNGDVSVACLNALGLDATVLGNHDFDYSFANLLRLAGKAEYSFLSANTKYKQAHQPAGATVYPEAFKPYIIKSASGLKIGIFGVTDDGSAATTLYTNTADIMWDDDLAKAGEVVKDLKAQGCDLIIALSHLHSKNAALVQKNKDVDISIGGGNDIAGRPTIINDVQYLVNPGKHGEALTQVNVMTFDGKVTGLVYNQIFLTNAYEEDPGVKAIVDDYNARIDAAMDVTIGYNAQNLEWSTAMVRTMNSPIANLVTDGLKAFFEADGAQLCIVNGGGIRAKLDEGEVTIREVTSVLPFDNNMMLVETSGKTIWAALANGISAYPASNGKFPQVSGMSYSFKAGEKNELVAVTLDNGESLDLNARYKVVINSFIAGGGDGYTMFNVLDSTKEDATDVKQLVFVNKTYMRDALLAYFEKNSSKDSPLVVDKSESRITIL
ncbi:MAG: bifunctional UDP-sugar hydrolase/5'-nucleotidase [Sphaerochaetaceae bacterium]|nr:bifunctional UDP-sugar hydrolase/5'-nucleotidase [Sphaerochaetaceae bacterium]